MRLVPQRLLRLTGSAARDRQLYRSLISDVCLRLRGGYDVRTSLSGRHGMRELRRAEVVRVSGLRWTAIADSHRENHSISLGTATRPVKLRSNEVALLRPLSTPLFNPRPTRREDGDERR